MFSELFKVPARGLEPPRGYPQWILNPSRLPIPPHRRGEMILVERKPFGQGLPQLVVPMIFDSRFPADKRVGSTSWDVQHGSLRLRNLFSTTPTKATGKYSSRPAKLQPSPPTRWSQTSRQASPKEPKLNPRANGELS